MNTCPFGLLTVELTRPSAHPIVGFGPQEGVGELSRLMTPASKSGLSRHFSDTKWRRH
jgi:hypothetical protein